MNYWLDLFTGVARRQFLEPGGMRPVPLPVPPRVAGRSSRRGIDTAVTAALLVVLASGCASYQKRKELQAVARDWCFTIRASQVLPVYPLTEDLQPGDVFLVTTPIGQEARLYSSKGFLPLDQHLVRLQPLDFGAFYQHSYNLGTNNDTPHHWQFPPGTPNAPAPGNASGNQHLANTDWASAPRAAFPTYTFSVKSGAGLKLAIPVQGVPIGLSFLKSGAASGSVTISDSYVYGVSYEDLAAQLQEWAGTPERQAWLADVRKGAGRPIYIRVVNRVYLAGAVAVSLRHQGSMGGSASGGEPKEVNLLENGDEGAATNYLRVLDLINKQVADTLPGGTVKFVQATSRAVSLNETFERPLVVGYLAFDFPVLPDGALGAPVATQERIRRKSQPAATIGELSNRQLGYRMLVQAVNASQAKSEIYTQAAAALGEHFKARVEKLGQQEDISGAFSDARLELLREKGTDTAEQVHRALFNAWKDNQ